MTYSAARIFKIYFATALLCGCNLAAYAQDGAASSGDKPNAEIVDKVGEITVTARKTEERLIDTPVSVTAVTASDIASRNITDISQIMGIAPGFFFQSSNTGKNDRSIHMLSIRGIVSSSDSDAEQGASVFIDGAPMNGGMVSGFEDFERVEVLRGPQSAYFGRSTFSGAVNFVTKTPGDALHGSINGELGEYGRANGNASLEGALIPGILKARVSAGYVHTDGQYTVYNNPDQRLGEQQTVSLSATLFFSPSDKFDAKLRVAGWNDNDGPSPSFGYGIGNGQEHANCSFSGVTQVLNGSSTWFCGKIPTPSASEINGDYVVTPLVRQLLAGNASDGSKLINAVGTSFLNHFGLARHAREASLNMAYHLGDFQLASISAWHLNNWQTLDDIDRRANDLLGGAATTNATSLHSRHNADWSQELRITSPRHKRLRAMLGVSYYHLNYWQSTNFVLTGTVRALNFGSIAHTRTTGIFGSVEYDLLDKVTLAAEGRFQWDNIEKANANGTSPLQATFTAFMPRYSINYKPTDGSLIYASYAKGVKPGTFNPSIATYSPSFIASLPPGGITINVDQETLEMEEIGYKAQLFNHRLQFDVSGFYGNWHPQVSIGTGPVTLPNGTITNFSLFTNAGRVKVWGAEFEAIAVPVRGLQLQGNFSLDDSKIDSLACQNCAAFNNASLVGKRYAASPKYQATGSVSYEHPLWDDLNGIAKLQWTYHSKVCGFGSDMLCTWYSPAASTVDLRLGFKKGGWSGEFYVTNLFNNKALSAIQTLTDYAYFGASPSRYTLAGSLATLRSYGFRFGYKF